METTQRTDPPPEKVCNRNHDENNKETKEEIEALRSSASYVVWYLVAVVLTCLAVGAALLAGWSPGPEQLRNVLLCVVAGTMGSGITAALSAAERRSNGWELECGCKLPQVKPKDKFVDRMVLFFLIRPFLGSVVGLLVYAGLTAGYLIAVLNPEDASFSDQGLFSLSALGGLFAKTFMEKLRDAFDTLFGKAKPAR